MQALDTEPSKRFQNASEMSEALSNPRYSSLQTLKLNRRDVPVTTPPVIPEDDAETMRIVPLPQKHLDHWQASRPQAPSSSQIPHQPLISHPISQPEESRAIQSEWQQQPATALEKSQIIDNSAIETNVEKEAVSTQFSSDTVETPNIDSQIESTTTWFKRIQRFILGHQQHTMIAAAIIESPLGVQPNQIFVLRIHILGRDESTKPLDMKEEDPSPGLSRLMNGDMLSIEVRALLNQNYTFVVQQAIATIPAAGYVVEITIPIRPFSNLPGGMRERLLISFLDKQSQPLYGKPFIVEVFISQHVKRGHEGHHVLTIPQ